MLQRTILSTVVPSGAHFPERTAAGLREVPAVSLVRGREAILAAQPLLTELAVRCGQSSELESLRYVLSTEDARKKLPWLVMIGERRRVGWWGQW